MLDKVLKILRRGQYSKTIVIIAIINIALAAAALLKDMIMASYFGTTIYADAFTMAFFIIDTVGNNLIAAAAAVSCVPVFTRVYKHKDETMLYKTLLQINSVFLVLTAVLAFATAMLKNQIIMSLARGLSVNTANLSVKLLILLLPAMLLYPAASIGISYLQVKGKFVISSLAQVLFNILLLFGLIYCLMFKLPLGKGTYVVTYFAVAAVIGMIVLLYREIFKERKVVHGIWEGLSNTSMDMFKLFIPYCIILLLSQLVLYYERYLASFGQGGSVAALNYAYRLAQFPIWVFVAAISTVLFPVMAKHNSKGDIGALRQVIRSAILWVLILTVPMIFILYILRVPIVTVLFLRGAFDLTSMKLTCALLSGYSFAIAGQSISAIGLRVFLSMEDVKTPVVIYFVSSTINIVLDYVLVSRLGLPGIGYGAAIGSLVNALLMLVKIRINIKHIIKKNIIKVFKFLLCSVLMIIICLLGNSLWNILIYKLTNLMQFLFIGIFGLVTILLYGAGIKILKIL